MNPLVAWTILINERKMAEILNHYFVSIFTMEIKQMVMIVNEKLIHEMSLV